MNGLKICRAVWPMRGPFHTEAALLRELRWPSRSVITVGFMTPNPALENATLNAAQQIASLTNLTFKPVPVAAEANIRIVFHDGGGGSSYIGRDCLNVKQQATMDLGIIGQSPDEQRRVVLHEFGHAVGLIHEHQNPAAGIPWDRPKVYSYFKATDGWTPQQVDSNIFDRYAHNITQYSAFDRQSIMLYGVPPQLTTDGRGLPWNRVLSPTDEAYLRRWYNPRVLETVLAGTAAGWVDTGLDVAPDSQVSVLASGTITFWMGTYPRNPDGRDEHGNVEAPAGKYGDGHPAPNAVKNSLVFMVGGRTFQGGTSTRFMPEVGGRLYMTNNDNACNDNGGGWTVRLEVS